MIVKLQNINTQLRNKIKDLNFLVEKAIEKQVKQVGKNKNKHEPTSVYAMDPDHLVRIRTKEIENTRKNIDYNNQQILQLNQKLKNLGAMQSDKDKQAEDGNKEKPVDWETKYLQQVEMKKQLQLTIKNLNR